MNILRPTLRPILRDVALSPDQRSGGGAPPAPPEGALEIDTFQVLIDGFPIIFS